MVLPGTKINFGNYVRWQQYHLEGLFTSNIAQCEVEHACQTWLQFNMKISLQSYQAQGVSYCFSSYRSAGHYKAYRSSYLTNTE